MCPILQNNIDLIRGMTNLLFEQWIRLGLFTGEEVRVKAS